LAGLHTSPVILKLIFESLFVKLFTNHAAITSSMEHFSYEAYSHLAGQQLCGCLKYPNNYCVPKKIY